MDSSSALDPEVSANMPPTSYDPIRKQPQLMQDTIDFRYDGQIFLPLPHNGIPNPTGTLSTIDSNDIYAVFAAYVRCEQ